MSEVQIQGPIDIYGTVNTTHSGPLEVKNSYDGPLKVVIESTPHEYNSIPSVSVTGHAESRKGLLVIRALNAPYPVLHILSMDDITHISRGPGFGWYLHHRDKETMHSLCFPDEVDEDALIAIFEGTKTGEHLSTLIEMNTVDDTTEDDEL